MQLNSMSPHTTYYPQSQSKSVGRWDRYRSSGELGGGNIYGGGGEN